VCLGTLEERIDQMIERKEELAEGIIGGGEQWIADLTTNQLRDIFQLRDSAMEAC
jgi:SNF2 family DNA or RNA helicase